MKNEREINHKVHETKNGIHSQTTSSERVKIDRDVLRKKGIKSPNL